MQMLHGEIAKAARVLNQDFDVVFLTLFFGRKTAILLQMHMQLKNITYLASRGPRKWRAGVLGPPRVHAVLLAGHQATMLQNVKYFIAEFT